MKTPYTNTPSSKALRITLTLALACVCISISAISISRHAKKKRPLAPPPLSDTLSCTESSIFYQVLEGNEFVSYNPYSAEFELIHSNPYEINAIGYNVEDNYIYGIRRSSNHLVRVGSTGIFQDLGAVSGLPVPSGSGYFTGDCDLSGNLFITNTYLQTIYKIDIDAQTVVNTYDLNTPLDAADFSYLPEQGKFYGATNDGGKLVSFDPATGDVNFYNNLSPSLSCSFTSGYGASFADAEGNLYVFCNSYGTLFKVDVVNMTTEFIQNTSVELTSNDGASCALSTGLPDPCSSVLTTYTPSDAQPDICCFILELHNFVPDFFSTVQIVGLDGITTIPMAPLNGWDSSFDNNEDGITLEAPGGVAPVGEYYYTRICLTDFEDGSDLAIELNYLSINGETICTDTLELKCQETLAQREPFPIEISLYPNPTTGEIVLEFSKPPATTLNLTLLDARGRVIKRQKIPGGSIRYLLDISDLPPAPYVIQITDKKGATWFTELIKQ